MDEKLLSGLIEYGFSDKEAKIYIATLELGSGAASTIGRRAGIKRVTAYSLLQDLTRKGIAKSIEKQGVLHFQVIDPTELNKKIEEKITLFKSHIPGLLAIADTYNNKPRIQYFEGVVGVKEMYEKLLYSSVSYSAFLGVQVINKTLLRYLDEEFLPKRIKKGIEARVILSNTPENKTYQDGDKQYLRESVLIDDDVFDLADEIILYGPGKVMISLLSDEELSGIVIHSEKLYKSLMSVFSLLRKSYKK